MVWCYPLTVETKDGVKHFNYISESDNLIKQTILDEYPHKRSNRIIFNHICDLINKACLKINDLDYHEAVRMYVNLIGNTVLPNSIKSDLEFQLFKYRYFYWTETELDKEGIRVEG